MAANSRRTGPEPAAPTSLLSPAQVVRFLLARKLLAPEAVVDGELRILASARRNAGFKVDCAGVGYVVKQAGGADRAAGLANEAAVYTWLAGAGGPAGLRHCLPHLYLYSPAERLLVLELFVNATSFSTHVQSGRFSTRLATALGGALARLHTLPVAGGRAAEPLLRPLDPPWVLALHRPDPALDQEASAANLQLIRVAQQFPEFGHLLDDLRAGWRPVCPIHNDLKWNNLLIVRTRPGAHPRLKIVDWELAGLGDPCWDAGAVFGEYLAFWASSIPDTMEGPPDTLLPLARYPLARMQPAIGCFWRAYIAGLGLTPMAAAARLQRSVRFAAARITQTAFEGGQNQPWLTNTALRLLQLAFNILQRPDEAALHLLGLPLGTAPIR